MFRMICMIVGLLFIIGAFVFLYFVKEEKQQKKKILKNSTFDILRQALYVIVGLIS